MDEDIITVEQARDIARHYQAPGNLFSAFAHGFTVNAFAFHAEVIVEQGQQTLGNARELQSLIDYIESVATINLSSRGVNDNG